MNIDSFKIDIFERNHPGQLFPELTTLNSEECRHIRDRLCSAVGKPLFIPDITLLNALRFAAVSLDLPNASDEPYDPSQALELADLLNCPTLLINWWRFDKVDRIATSDFIKFFNDLWYKGSDDVEMFNESLSNFLMLSHSGTFRLLRLGVPLSGSNVKLL